MSFSPTITTDSKTVPGVRFTIRRIGFARRTELDLQTLKLRQRLRELEQEYPPLTKAERDLQEQVEIARHKAITVPDDQVQSVIDRDIIPLADQLSALSKLEVKKARVCTNEEYATVTDQIRTATIHAGLVSIEGGEVDGMTVDQLLDYGPPRLAEEIGQAIENNGALRGSAALNFLSRGDSTVLAMPPTNGTTAQPAAPQAESMSDETAFAISPTG